MDIAIVEIVSPHEAAVGYYAAVLSVIGIFWVIPASIYFILKPNVAPLLKLNDYKQLQSIIDHVNCAVYGVLLLLIVVMNVFSHEIFLLFGKEFAASTQITFLIMSIGFLIDSYGKPSTIILNNSGHENKVMRYTVIEFCILLVLGPILTYYFGIVGTASSVTIALIVFSLLSYFTVKRNFPLRPCLI